MTQPQRDPAAPSDEQHPGLLQRLAFLFRTYAVPADGLRLRGPFLRDDRHCFMLPLPREWASDEGGTSLLELFEDGEPLGPAHCSHDDIRTLGRGRYSHWGAALYFSTSDNTDPNDNARIYAVTPPEGWTGTLPRPSRDARQRAAMPAPPPAAGAHAAAFSAAGSGSGALKGVPRSLDPRARLQWALFAIKPRGIIPFDGHAYSLQVPAHWPSDATDVSTLVLLENDRVLPLPHAMHADIVGLGHGRYSHWNSSVLFATSDNSDPRTNGRRYVVASAQAMLVSQAPRPPAHDSGHCYVLTPLPRHWVADDGGVSRVMLLEDGRPLGPAHASHEEIRTLGAGRLSHWAGQLWFSTSDNTDPRANGRTYVVVLLDD